MSLRSLCKSATNASKNLQMHHQIHTTNQNMARSVKQITRKGQKDLDLGICNRSSKKTKISQVDSELSSQKKNFAAA
jgi:hypothetical protein